jgi:hypothetical protein
MVPLPPPGWRWKAYDAFAFAAFRNEARDINRVKSVLGAGSAPSWFGYENGSRSNAKSDGEVEK